jgi:hypothetical protein
MTKQVDRSKQRPRYQDGAGVRPDALAGRDEPQSATQVTITPNLGVPASGVQVERGTTAEGPEPAG